MTFGQILSRGVSAAHRSIPGFLLLFLLYGVFEGLSPVMVGLMRPEKFAMQPGQPPPPEFAMLMIYGCFSCLWILVMVFVGPWVTAGTVGQFRDHIEHPGNIPGSFSGYGGRFYLPMLVLTLIFFVIVVLLYLIMGLITAAIMFDKMGRWPMQPAQVQQFQMQPATILTGLLAALLVVAMAIVFNLANSIVLTRYMDAFTALTQAFALVRRQFGDACKLWGVTALLALVVWGVSVVPQFFGVHNLTVLVILGIILAVYLPYAFLLSLGWSVSLVLARSASEASDVAEPSSDGGTAGDADQPSGESMI